MSISLYDSTVARFIQGLKGVTTVLDIGSRHCVERQIDPDVIVESRLFPDMLPFRFQLVSVAHHSIGALQGARTGSFAPPSRDSKLDYSGLQTLIAEAHAALVAAEPEEVDGLVGKLITFEGRGLNMKFKAEDFLLSFSLPNFYFHATTAYDLLRSAGVPLSKRDYLGPFRTC